MQAELTQISTGAMCKGRLPTCRPWRGYQLSLFFTGEIRKDFVDPLSNHSVYSIFERQNPQTLESRENLAPGYL